MLLLTWCTDISSSLCFQLFWVCTWKWNCWIIWFFYVLIFLKNHHAVCHSSYTILYSHQQCAKVPTSPHRGQHFFCSCFFFFFIVAILMGVRQHLISILIFIPLWLVPVSLFISLMVSNRELLFSYAYWASLFLCSLAICTSFSEKCWSPLTNFSIGLFVLLGSKNSLYILDINSLSAIWFANACPIPWRRQWHPTPVLLPGKSHGRRSLVGCSPWGR